MTIERSARPKTTFGFQTVDPDEEDRRLDRLKKMNEQELDYSGITRDVLKFTNYNRQPNAATTL